MRMIGNVASWENPGKYKVREQQMNFDNVEAIETYQAENPNAFVRHWSVINGVISAQMWHMEEVKTNE